MADVEEATPWRRQTSEEARGSSLTALRELLSGQRPGLAVLIPMFFMEICAFGLLIPVVAFFCMTELGMDSWQVGVAMAAHAASQVVGSWTAGRVSDTTGRRPVLVLVFTVAGVCFGATAFVYSFLQFVGLRVAQGLAGGTWSLSDAYVLDVAPATLRAGYVGIMSCAVGTAFTVGPGLAALLLYFEVGRRTIFLIAGAIGLAAALLGFCLLRESLPEEKRRSLCSGSSENGQTTASDWSAVSRGLVCIWFASFMMMVGSSILFATYSFLIRDLFGWTDYQFALILSAGSIIGALTGVFLFPWLVSRIGSSYTLAVGSACGAVGFALMPMPNVGVHVVAQIFKVLCWSVAMPSLNILVGEHVGEEFLGFANGVKGSCMAASRIGGPLMGGYLYKMSPYYAYYLGSALIGVVALCGLGLACICPASPQERKPLKESGA